jgi:hypothetical protein
MKYEYTIAEVTLHSQRDLVALGLKGFKPFESQGGVADCSLHFAEELSANSFTITKNITKSYIAEAQTDAIFARTTTGYIYSIKSGDGNEYNTIFHIDTSTNVITTNIVCSTLLDVALLRFGLWIMFGVVIAPKGGIAIHSSAITHNHRAVLFLGESGTGKSTHTRLWREHIDGATLLNDDSPILRIVDGQVRIYGSPWSGKTPCYKNVNYPIAGFCRLSQAPHNKIRPLRSIAAIGAVLPSCPPQFANDNDLQDAICRTLGEVLRSVAVYHLECLPNSEAAELSFNTIMGDA